MEFGTKSIRVAQNPEKAYRSVSFPLYQTSTFAWDQIDEEPSTAYSRVANPNRSVFESVLAEMENAAYCTAFSSGMAAVVGALSGLQNGDHIVMASDLYGGTQRYIEAILPRQGITCSSFDSQDPSTLAEAVQPNSKYLMFESPTNPLLKVCDIAAVVKEAKKYNLITVFDNTFASPALQNPLDFGVDIVLHSTTKYINGHSDTIGGAVMTNDPEIGEWLYEWVKNTGACPSPFDCWLALRGLKTLALRVEKHCKNAQIVAEWLEKHPQVSKVYYPGLPSHPNHELSKTQLKGFGGMLSFEIGDEAIAKKVALGTKIFLLAESLGGVESLIGYPKLMSHGCLTEEQRQSCGIYPNLLRLSVGIEDPIDLIKDLEQAFELATFGASHALINGSESFKLS